MKSSLFLEEAKVFIETYCVTINDLGILSSYFETDHDRIEFLYFAFSHLKNLEDISEVEFHFEDESYQDVFISFLRELEKSTNLELSTTEQEVLEIQKLKHEGNIQNNDITIKIVYVPNYRGRIGVDRPMSPLEYQKVQKAIQLEHVPSNRVDIFINQIENKGMSVQQLNGILSLYNYENEKMKVFNIAIEKVYDLDNLITVRNHFINLFNKREIDRITLNELDKYTIDIVTINDSIEYRQY